MRYTLNKYKPGPLTSLAILAFGILILTGCKAGKNYVKPDLNLPATFRHTDAIQIDSATTRNEVKNIGELTWEEFFEDSILVKLINKGMQNNLGLQQANGQMKIAEEYLKKSKANFFPEIAVGPSHESRRFSDKSYARPNNKHYEGVENPPSQWFLERSRNMFAMQSSWEIDLWGKFRREKESSLAKLVQQESFQKAVKTDLTAEIATAYYKLMMLKEQLDVAEFNLRLNDSTLSIVELQYASGMVSSLAITQTESQKLISASLVPQIEKQIAIQENNLSQLLGEYPGEKFLVKRDLADIQLLSEIAVGVPMELVRNRPDVIASEMNLVSANADVGIAQAMRYPSLRIGADVGFDALNPGDIFNPTALFGRFVGSLTQPVFQNRKLKTNYKVSLIERDNAELAFREEVIGAVTEISNKLISIQKAEEEYNIAKERLKNSRRAVRDSYLLFSSGYANYLEVINAQSNALETELYMVDVKMQLLIANIELYRSLGGGWK
ncbi:efflux transporter outer membrane subunit [Echinicola salinicaeni]|uniref:efflux transporter outer membrane subunit n=1 Tax=Echinicola salinicaeni TaxID=2762757 RepID=UPI0016494375|nr:efflux transporter outer membrane subunit [Echinicola salinicaeni]